MPSKLRHPLRYYLTRKIVDVGGRKVPYTPATERRYEIRQDKKLVGRLSVVGEIVFIGYDGLHLNEIEVRHAGE